MLKVVGASWYQTKMITIILGTMVALGVVVYIFGENEIPVEDGIYSATVTWTDDSRFQIGFWGQGNNLNEIPKGIARAHYKLDTDQSGWAYLEVQTQADADDWKQAFAAGLLEGALSWHLIYHHWFNTMWSVCSEREEYCKKVRSFISENIEWVKETALEQESKDPFWHQVHLYYMQLHGLIVGFHNGAVRGRMEIEISEEDFIWMNIISDLVELEQKFNGSGDIFSVSSVSNLSSAFVKLLPETRTLFVAHNTGGMYQSMLRVIKSYEFHYHLTSAVSSPEVPGQVISFSSYPGLISSHDDFYSVSSVGGQNHPHRLTIAGTTINNFNVALWNLISPLEKVLLAPRVMSANRLATCGLTWSKTAMRYNSGTGNKQWLVADYKPLVAQPMPPKEKKFRHKKKRLLQDMKGLLWVVEQYPGTTHSSDQSFHLQKATYWAAFGGIPFHKDISDVGNLGTMEEIFGPSFSRDRSPIAKMFRRDHTSAVNTSSVMALMRNNNFLHDSLSQRNPMIAIAPRGDVAENPKPIGAIDTKVISYTPDLHTQFEAISGPPLILSVSTGDDSDDNVESDVANYRSSQSFKWSLSSFDNTIHFGHPDVWHFSKVNIKWYWSEDSNRA